MMPSEAMEVVKKIIATLTFKLGDLESAYKIKEAVDTLESMVQVHEIPDAPIKALAQSKDPPRNLHNT